MGKVEAQCWPLLGSWASLHLGIWRQMSRERERASNDYPSGTSAAPLTGDNLEDKSEACQLFFLEESSQCVVQAGLEPRDPPASASRKLRLQVVYHLGQLLSDRCYFCTA